jgi:hypothetical protein
MLIGAQTPLRFRAVYVIRCQRTQRIQSTCYRAAIIMGRASGDRLGNALGSGSVSEAVPVVVALAPLADGNNREDSGIVYLLRSQP